LGDAMALEDAFTFGGIGLMLLLIYKGLLKRLDRLEEKLDAVYGDPGEHESDDSE